MSHDNCRATSSARRFKRPSLLTLGIAAAVLSSGQQSVMAAPELEEIVVTAQKREQRIQDVPIFVSVLSGDQLSAANIMNFSELGKLTPGVAIDGPAGGLGSTIYVRGIGVTKYIEGIRPSVGIFVDDVPLSRIDNAFTNFSDIDRIEVLKGPQATLFGKEVASGAIAIHTIKPSTDGIEGNLDLNVGNFDLQEYRGAVNLPLGSATAARFSGYWTTRESEIKNVVTSKQGETDTWGGRLRVLQRIGDDAEAILTVERHQVKVRDMMKEQTSYGTSTLGFAAATHTQLLPIRVFDRKAQADAGNGHDQTTTNAALRVSWKINDAWSLVSITGHQKFSRDSDKGGRPGGVNNTSRGLFGTFSFLGYVDDKSLTQELRLTYDGESLSSIIGAFYEDTKLRSITNILTKSPARSTPLQSFGDRRGTDHAIFTHNIYQFDDRWTLTAGLRYSEVEKDDRVDNLINVGAFGAVPSRAVPAQKDKWTSVSGTAKVAYKISDEVNLYGGYDRGFKAGGHNTLSSRLPKFDEETVDNFEIGVKGLSFDRRLRWAASVFYTKYKDFQVNSPDPVGGTSYIQNAASVHIPGVEGEFTWMVNDNFTLEGSLAYIDAKFDDFKYAECNDDQKVGHPRCTQDLSGKRINGNSPWTWNLAGLYEVPISNTNLKWFLRGEVMYRDETQGSSTLDRRTVMDDYTLVNASAGLTSVDGAWSLSLWGKNLTDKDYISSFELARDGAFGWLAELGDSRAYGVNFKYKF
ncbi:MAG: TonB-dependent receptor [Pseudomonadales bacterium]|jgi:iron complex outermembrane receptor protein|nr:TonB-dependent receptor [Pseudomonadales bacterium]MCP5337150.1 TonB-dependent receptor [Pseudomonadales bacterium]